MKSWMNTHPKLILLCGTGIAALIYIIMGWNLTVPVISDETITMANAAAVTGHDWSYMIAAVGGYYYKYLEALMAVPFFWMFKNPDTIYRVTMVFQGLIQVSIIPVIYRICKKFLKVDSAPVSVLIGMGVCFIPSAVLNTFYFRGDYLLFVLPWYVLWMLLESMHASNVGKGRLTIVFSALAALFSIMAYMSHTRGIVPVIALCMTVLVTRLFTKTKSVNWIILVFSVIVLILADYVVGGQLKTLLYSVSGVQSNSFETVDAGKYFNIFSFTMLKCLFFICVGWMYTLISSTFGLTAAGILALCLLVRQHVWKTKNPYASSVFVFGGLTFLGYYGVGALFFKRSYLAFTAGDLTRRSDRLLYDRYAICGLGFVIFAALYLLYKERKLIKLWHIITTLVMSGVIYALTWWRIVPITSKYKGYIYNSIIIGTFTKIRKASQILFGEVYSKKALAILGALALLALILILWAGIQKKRQIGILFFVAILLLEAGLTGINYRKIRKNANDYIEEQTQEVTAFLSDLDEKTVEDYPYVLKGGLPGTMIQFYQGRIMDYRLIGLNKINEVDATDYFVITIPEGIEKLENKEDLYSITEFESNKKGTDSLYIKGNALREELEGQGYHLEPVVLSEAL